MIRREPGLGNYLGLLSTTQFVCIIYIVEATNNNITLAKAPTYIALWTTPQ